MGAAAKPASTPPAPGALRMVSALFVAGLSSGIALAGVYAVTAPRIAEHRVAALSRAVLAVVPGATRFEPRALPDGTSGVYAASDDSGHRLGYAIQAEGPGFMDTITLLYGYEPAARRVVGLRILDSRETPGLGDKIMTDPAFVESFVDLRVEPAIVPKTNGPRAQPNEVDCISGATISSKAVVSIVQTSVARIGPLLANQLEEAP